MQYVLTQSKWASFLLPHSVCYFSVVVLCFVRLAEGISLFFMFIAFSILQLIKLLECKRTKVGHSARL